ncbi:MAG: pilus assembly protein TadB [Acidimicrobiales bacterium]
MTAVLGAAVGMAGALGVLLLLLGAGLVPGAELVSIPRSPDRGRGIAAGVGAVAALGGWAVTGWPAVAALIAGTAVVLPELVAAERARSRALARTEALASWAEMLRDTIASHAGLREAVVVTAAVAPDPIAGPVRRLASGAERTSLSVGLARFGEEVADPIADLIVAALGMSADGQARNLPALLTGIADAARAEATMRQRVETGRARTYSSSRALVAITMGMSLALAVFAPTFMRPYREPLGQLVLVIIAGLFVAALHGLVRLSRPEPSPRMFVGLAPGPSPTEEAR